MAYEIKEADDAMAIKEREYGCAEEVRFTKVDSCIGILAKKKGEDMVIGIHLSLFDEGGNKFDENAVGNVMDCLGEFDEKNVVILGSLGIWERDLKNYYNDLKNKLNIENEDEQLFSLGPGTYGGKIDNKGKIEKTWIT
ncbi:MAG: hypothetical protein JSU92_06395 [Deltaproteobacteria bacterium]|nr:MAG: hypothetical protein JSU92_06395 [Deltaproteobacteria bacterium]